MCGIAGVFHHQTERAIDPQTLVNMAAIMHHRGPDGFGYEVQEDYGVGFSHARLSIIDLDEKRGRQPFLSTDKRLMLTHNGEFYDFKRIRADLTARGARFNSKSDSEIVLHLFERFGLEDTLKELRGEFAFGLFDAKDESLYLVRDRFGVKPLYWTETEHGVVFGSELKVLFAHPEVKREFSAEGLYHQLIQVMVPGSTAFEGINQVQPGYVVKLQRKNGKVVATEHKYWDVDFPPEESYPGADVDEEEYIEGVRSKLLEAVQHRMTADVPVGCYLSGGIDSCAILGLASASTQTSVKAFTIGFDSADYDETPIAQEMAEATHADHHIMRLKADDLYDHFVKTLWHTERTIYNTLGVAKYLMSKEVHEAGYKVVMTGEGSDELFAGYPAFRQDMFLHGLDHLPEVERVEWQELLEKNNKLFKGAMLAREEFVSDAFNQKMGFTPSCVQPWLSCSSVALPLMSEEKRQQVEGYEPSKAIADTLDENMLDGRHPLDRAQYVWIKTMLEGQILTWGGDRVDMANSMEARPAFLDHHLAEYAFSVPPHLRIKGNKEKYVLREAMKGLLPETLYKREKFAFMAPPAHTDPEKWKAVEKLAHQFLNEDFVKSAGLLDYDEVVRTFERHQDDNVPKEERVQLDAVINHMLGVQVLYHHFVATDVPKQARQRASELGWTV
ncbi:asparagine synthase (glutamine-hydrolyzing) [Idiomarina aminovorans]|uniref:asparagine synthase (glutamine-hydrolyzing) n=1 Tax=Idiomarina aminovorans TaxID=2914829 RepID=UPI0020049526|nr:asparagine synthase (glutamine-hydrolyzing) [Idiomarina sp. ATCH4]MCK7458323.1 asparagine synthase (glutamine-hydrolyzing) [Idiomarina sp. ATCH4]